MIRPNMHYADLKQSYLFYRIAQKTKAYSEANPEKHLYRMGIGDVSQPLCPAVISALHAAVEDQADADRFHGYMPECGAAFLREAIAAHYAERGVALRLGQTVASAENEAIGTDCVVAFSDGQTERFDEVVLAQGVAPNLDFVSNALQVDKGLLVDEFMRTSAPDVFAAGDVAQALDLSSGRERVIGLWQNAVQQGR